MGTLPPVTNVPAAGPHGGDAARLAAALGLDPSTVLDLSHTLNPFAADPQPIVARHLGALGHYPDPSGPTAVLAHAIGVDPNRLLLTNGGSEAISLVATELGGGVLEEPEFSLHPRGPGVRWRSDPHNPSGTLADASTTADVWDEAFYPLATGRWHAGRPGVTVGSLTKVFACPGLRLGYVIADDVGRFANHQPLWSVNALALAALGDLLALSDLPEWAEAIAAGRKELQHALTERGFDVTASAAPWVLVHAPGLRERLAPTGVVVRDCASFAMPGWARIAVPGAEGLRRLLEAIDATSPAPAKVSDRRC